MNATRADPRRQQAVHRGLRKFTDAIDLDSAYTKYDPPSGMSWKVWENESGLASSPVCDGNQGGASQHNGFDSEGELRTEQPSREDR